MKLLGRGWQYSTYDIGNGRVLKKYHSVISGHIQMFKECFPFRDDPIWKLPGFYKGCRETALDSIKKISNGSCLESWILGNPRILNTLDYEQDRLLPLHEHFETVDTETGKKTIDAFVVLSKLLVEKKLIDKSFNIAKNFALDSSGRVVLMDLGELYSSDAAIQKQINKRAWAANYVVKPLPEPLKEYFVKSMDTAFAS
jgi:hypothetical protein